MRPRGVATSLAKEEPTSLPYMAKDKVNSTGSDRSLLGDGSRDRSAPRHPLNALRKTGKRAYPWGMDQHQRKDCGHPQRNPRWQAGQAARSQQPPQSPRSDGGRSEKPASNIKGWHWMAGTHVQQHTLTTTRREPSRWASSKPLCRQRIRPQAVAESLAKRSINPLWQAARDARDGGAAGDGRAAARSRSPSRR
jgi:hypothetical protein